MTTTTTPAPSLGSGRARVAEPLRVGAAALAATAVLAVGNPNTTHVPLCPLKAVTGLDCPLCGSLRAVHALTRGDIAGAANHNLLFTVAAPFLVLAWGWWLLDTLDRRPPGTPLVEAYRRHATLLRWVGVAVLVTFAVVRNLPSMSWLGSTA